MKKHLPNQPLHGMVFHSLIKEVYLCQYLK